jgi:dipeptide/tripeptide permease
MQGLEYLFVLIFSAVLVAIKPKLVGERFTRSSVPTLVAAVVLIGFGLVLLTR